MQIGRAAFIAGAAERRGRYSHVIVPSRRCFGGLLASAG